MTNFLIDPEFDPYRAHIERQLREGKTWIDLRVQVEQSFDALDSWFVSQQTFSSWPSLGSTPQARRATWIALLDAKEDAESRMTLAKRPLVVVGREETEPNIKVPEAEHSSWQLYRAHLQGQGWNNDAITPIEESSLRILKRLRKKTAGMPPVRGMVVGHVQSGKTASIAGLSAMAADHGWNLVIVLSGTLENLRRQTLRRLVKDLNHPGNLHWVPIDQPSGESPHGQRTQDKHFMPGSTSRHLVVCLKNPTRLKNLLDWITKDEASLDQMRILIIDDEADQASINTAAGEQVRTTINKAIISLTQVKALSVNYVGYTATPAANFLNEGPGEGLYPQDFILSLPQSDKHFGPPQIFGIPERGIEPLEIVSPISSDDLSAIRNLHDEPSASIPNSLADALCWFVCAAATFRVYGIVKPVSMLVHTSQRQHHHKNIAEAVRRMLLAVHADQANFIAACRKTWGEVGAKLDRDNFKDRFPDYGWPHSVRDYPEFDTLIPHIEELLSEVSAIPLDEEGSMAYHRGIHLCIDNCANNGISDENEVRRLIYPDPDDPRYPQFSTAFIVVGGSTLARGLTIENLVSTYFLRTSVLGDSLMQMGRWFGYRKGYELIPRIWMPQQTRKKFEFLTQAEEELRDELNRFMDGGADPSDFGPRVRAHPRASWLRPTAKNRMREAQGAEYDFSGVNRQTTIFHSGDESYEIHQRNMTFATEFLESLGDSRENARENALVWRGIAFDAIESLLSQLMFHPNAQFFSDLAPFLEWYRQQAAAAGYGDWNVVAAGTSAAKEKQWKVCGKSLGLVTRTRVMEASREDAVSIGVLRDPLDLLADIDTPYDVPDKLSNEVISDLRTQAGLHRTPQLLLYLIDKDSKPSDLYMSKPLGERSRGPLDAADNIVGVSLWLPGTTDVRRSYATHLTVRIPSVLASDEDDIPGTGIEDN
ncbi:Z1 domain-containing protein [Serratia marcescens]|jgi:hypothetical protein|uniref:Z1 domain-containing protein n=1 Tax=Serratia marcescens TaxID=615 RepID=UPI0023A9272D|nr:Z1 domain-containing protein [Serratia marcescens]WEA49531.1 Z1 domain-containing protein [Serratia marcescens]